MYLILRPIDCMLEDNEDKIYRVYKNYYSDDIKFIEKVMVDPRVQVYRMGSTIRIRRIKELLETKDE